jgi:hypothetical protein
MTKTPYYQFYGLREMIAACSAELHISPQYADFYDSFSDELGGHFGVCSFSAKMGEVLYSWEYGSGGRDLRSCILELSWLSIIEDFARRIMTLSLASGELADPADTLAKVIASQIELKAQL